MSSLYTALCSHLLFPLHEVVKGHASVAVRKRLERSQWLSPAALTDEQLNRLRAFLSQVGRSVPYYRSLFEAHGFDPQGLSSVAELAHLPLLDKTLIRRHTEALKAEGHGPLTRYNTGGSSGEPLIFFMGKARKSHDVGAKWRATRWWGVDIGDPELVVWGSPVELGAQDRVRQLRDAVMRSSLLPAFEMSEGNLDRFVAEIVSKRPAMLFGYPSSLSLIAAHADKRGIALGGLGIKVVFVTSERLYDDQRQTLERAFACPVANGYGARDAGFIAHQCPSGKLHISAEDIVVEIVRADGTPAGAGELGEIVVTHMATADFPFIRYRTGDVGRLGQQACACGRGLPVLEEVQGRTTDFVYAKDGTVMHGLALIYVLRDLPTVQRFRIEQLSLDETVVQVVPGAGFDQGLIAQIQQAFQRRLGADVRVRVDCVDEIPAEASGKFRYVVSRVKPEQQAERTADA
ncbi:phenylacetate--CoA ligase family protein [Roseateles oligotrophus]|uniref:Phenylacetate--CoA ligase family protein n=1 Tax=Roseateles oligotrophus TaxID=1769250 RepID=A0ABT2YFB0_9BURK|nr:phenylacetate--CoA ligase family protein [Roseateles oligotrophus]MCV2368738.1 phenylacetate--CoA ligase family protein [Roseateles oligotrophus]